MRRFQVLLVFYCLLLGVDNSRPRIFAITLRELPEIGPFLLH